MRTKKSAAIRFLEKLTGGPLTFARMLESIRLCDEETQPFFAKKLGISKSNLNDIEKGRTGVSPKRAAQWAKILGYSEPQFVRLALQDSLDREHLKFEVSVQKVA